MKIQPVKRHITPKYPDQYAIDLDKTLLHYRPARWARAPLAGATLTAVVALGLSGCGRMFVLGGGGSPPPEGTPPEAGGVEHVVLGDMTVATPLLPGDPVPLFEHGEGVGVYGCVSVTAPAFLSEDDAFAILSDEFSKLGYDCEQGGRTVSGIQLPVTSISIGRDAGSPMETRKGALTFDMCVNDLSLQIEYVSMDDFYDWVDGKGPDASVESYDVKGAAQTLGDSLNEAGMDAAHGVFYDPIEMGNLPEWTEGMTPEAWEAALEDSRAEARLRSEEDLREQVRDFIAWLSAQGII